MDSTFNLRYAELLVVMRGDEVTTQFWFPKVELEVASSIDDYGYCDYDLGLTEFRSAPTVRRMEISGNAFYDAEHNMIMEVRQIGPKKKRRAPRIPTTRRGY